MPVPNQKINNQFLPLDDLGLEIDPSYRLYLPSDVSLSVATMVGRNGRKPRIVQMDDDGALLVNTSGSTLPIKVPRYEILGDNKFLHNSSDQYTVDLRGATYSYIGLYCQDINNGDSTVVASVDLTSLTGYVLYGGTSLNVGGSSGNTIQLTGPDISASTLPYAHITVGLNGMATEAHYTLEVYLI